MRQPSRKVVRTAVCSALAAALLGAAGAARTETDSVTAVDMPALVAQTMDLVRRTLAEQPIMLTLDDDAMAMPSNAYVAREFGNPREIVKNAPYTAEAVTEFVQTLPDGNRIVKKSTTLLARDTMGRTRQERTGDGRAVYLYDPLENRSVVIDTERRIATRIPRVPAPPIPPQPPTPPSAPTPPTPPTPPAPPAPGAGAGQVEVGPGRVVVRRGGADGAPPNDVEVEVVRVGRGDHSHSMSPPITLPILPRGKGETKSLGTREFDGINADGMITTHTIAAGTIGNEKPIVVSTERWYSPELFVVVYAKSIDPRAGETTYRLVNVKRGEPPADLFKVPADVRVRGEKQK